MPEITTCQECWKHITAAIDTVFHITCQLRVQDIERLYERDATLPISERRLLRLCADGSACQETVRECKNWVDAWEKAFAAEKGATV